MSEAAPDKQNHPMSELALTGWLTLALVFYVLSVGPMSFLVSRYWVNSSSVRTFYTPLIWAHEHTVLRRPIEAYVLWWNRIARK